VPGPRDEYEHRIARWSDEVARGERAHLRLASLRLAVAGAGILLAWLAFGRGVVAPAWVLVPAVGFGGLVVAHARLLARNERAARALDVYRRGVDRLDDRWAGAGPDGARYVEGHPYARDLDLFGPASLFQLLGTARTEAGEDMLADWLRAPADPGEIRARQLAVEELRPRIDFREDVAVIAAETPVGRTTPLAAWASAPPVGLPRGLALVFGVAAALNVLFVAAGFAGQVSAGVVFLWLGVEYAGVVFPLRRRMAEVLERSERAAYELGLLTELLARLEREEFSAPRLTALHEALVGGGAAPSRRIRSLQRITGALDHATHNVLFVPLGYLLLVRGLAAVAIDRWHADHGAALVGWLRAIGEFEALLAFATYGYEHPAYPFPDLHPDGAMFHAEALAHPLLGGHAAVPNDVRLGGAGPRVLVVSGSNMSGKSTLLRAVGVNAVLALAGAPVRAARMTVGRVAIGATLRIEDSLQEGHSRFYSEILRIRDIVQAARGSVPVLFLLDEILHGTNSYDRRIGAEAIVRALVEAGAIGLVTTHDLALTELVATLGGRAANVHFEDRLEGGRMAFDYRMREGVVERSNALALMRAVGLDV
jgi:hypothetical protein